MCSIAGAKQNVDKMLKMMEHRSPDGMNVWTDGTYEIGMGRLAIIDTKQAVFPFEYKKWVLTFNGEIYNYIELRDELKALGHTFITEGDTEVLVHSYEEWGENCLDKFNGMFAFAIYDKEEKILFLARDIAGEKPLYYTMYDGYPVFASESKVFARGTELPPAHKATYEFSIGQFIVEPWWKFTPREINLETAEEELEELLADSIRLRTRSDVPYGLYLSDGVDSNLLSTFHKFDHTFTYTDGDYAKEFEELFPKIVWHLDAPIDSFSPFGLWKLAEEAHKKGVKVVLSGEGADELFGGYVRYVPNALNYEGQKRFPSYKGMFPYKGDLGWIDFNDKMRGLLRMGDRMASAWGIENRCPFLDRRIIEFAFSLPPELKAYGFDTKIILRRILAKRKPDYVPKEKHGLYCSVNKWLGVEDKLGKSAYLKKQIEQWQKYQ